MALRYQADTQTKPLGANANTPLQGNTAFKDGQLAEVILLITGRFTVGEGYNGIHKLFQQLRHRFAVRSSCPASKSIQCFFFAASSLLVAIFTVGNKAAVRRAATGAEQHHMAAGAGQRAGGDRVVARRAQ